MLSVLFLSSVGIKMYSIRLDYALHTGRIFIREKNLSVRHTSLTAKNATCCVFQLTVLQKQKADILPTTNSSLHSFRLSIFNSFSIHTKRNLQRTMFNDADDKRRLDQHSGASNYTETEDISEVVPVMSGAQEWWVSHRLLMFVDVWVVFRSSVDFQSFPSTLLKVYVGWF